MDSFILQNGKCILYWTEISHRYRFTHFPIQIRRTSPNPTARYKKWTFRHFYGVAVCYRAWSSRRACDGKVPRCTGNCWDWVPWTAERSNWQSVEDGSLIPGGQHFSRVFTRRFGDFLAAQHAGNFFDSLLFFKYGDTARYFPFIDRIS